LRDGRRTLIRLCRWHNLPLDECKLCDNCIRRPMEKQSQRGAGKRCDRSLNPRPLLLKKEQLFYQTKCYTRISGVVCPKTDPSSPDCQHVARKTTDTRGGDPNFRHTSAFRSLSGSKILKNSLFHFFPPLTRRLLSDLGISYCYSLLRIFFVG
jgi:hypothetical protein